MFKRKIFKPKTVTPILSANINRLQLMLSKSVVKLFLKFKHNPFIFKRDIYHTLNLPPRHIGLWSEESFKSLEKYYRLKAIDVRVAKLREVRKYLNVYLEYNNLHLKE